jgi:hypothetical protein
VPAAAAASAELPAAAPGGVGVGGAAAAASILTLVRIKPVAAAERDGFASGRGSLSRDAASGRAVLQLTAPDGAPRAFAPDAVLDAHATQRETYAACAAPLVAGVLAGTNAAVIAYGQTGSGKTHVRVCSAAAGAGECIPGAASRGRSASRGAARAGARRQSWARAEAASAGGALVSSGYSLER